MAATYYKYAEREADSQVNWAKVGKDLSDMLIKETELREQKKKQIDDESSRFGQQLEEAPVGNADEVNAWTTTFAADMQEYRLRTDKLLKSGMLKLKDHTLIRQNSVDGTRNIFALAKEYQAEYDDKTKRRIEGVSSEQETQFMALIEGFSNLSETKALINPTTGAVSIGKMERGPDGVLRLKEGNENYMTAAQARQRIKEKIDKYKLTDALSAEVKLLGKTVEEVEAKTGTIYSQGMIERFIDPTRRKELSEDGKKIIDVYQDLENKIIDAKTASPFDVSSILFDWTGGIDPNTNLPYQVTVDQALANTSSHYVLWNNKQGIFQPDFESTQFGQLQLDHAKEYTRARFRGMLEKSKELKPTSQLSDQSRQPTSTDYERADLKTAADNFGKNLAFLVSGTAAQKKLAANYFKGFQGIKGFDINEQGINILRGSESIPNAYNGTAEEYGGSLISILNNAVGLPENMIMDAFRKFLPSQNISKINVGRIENIKGADFKSEIGKYASTNVAIAEDDPNQTIINLGEKFGDLGFAFSGRTDGTDDYISILAPNGTSSPEFLIDDLSNRNLIIKFIQDNFDKDVAEQFFNAQSQNQGQGQGQGGQAPRS